MEFFRKFIVDLIRSSDVKVCEKVDGPDTERQFKAIPNSFRIVERTWRCDENAACDAASGRGTDDASGSSCCGGYGYAR